MKAAVAGAVAAVLLASSALAEPETLAFVRKGAQERGPDETAWGDVGHDRDRLDVLWDRYRQKGKPPAIAFDEKVAVVAGTGGSGSCPTRLHDLRLHRERGRVVVRVYTEAPPGDGGCTDDWVPKTFTVSVKRSDLKPLKPRAIDVRVRRIEDPDG
ncbi:MAG TPA: hypothetical protein VEV43_12285 [Actinomycetota bacterium]|nr:hypothetical protein [Actinomycetota bacterium]